MSYNTSSNRTYQPAFQRRIRDSDQETPARFPGAFQSQKQTQNNDMRTSRAEFPGAFQQKKRDYEPRSGAGASGYRSWKQSEQVAKAKPVDFNSTEDFPTLGASTVVKATQQQGVSLAEKLKTVIQQEQEEATHRRYQKDADRKDDAMFVIPMSSHWQRRQLEKKIALEAKQREIEEEEKRYRWNVSSEITPDLDDDAEQEYNDHEYEQEEDQTCYDKHIDN